MKSTRVRRHFSKYILLILTAITAGITPACIDDMIWREDPNSGDGIRFGVTVEGGWQLPTGRPNDTRSDAPIDKLILNDSTEIPLMETIPMEGTFRGKKMCLHAEVENWDAATQATGMSDATEAKTRGIVVAGENPMYPDFGVSAYHYDKSYTWPEAPLSPWHPKPTGLSFFQAPNHFENLTAVGDDSKYAIRPTIFWPETGKARLLAYAPKSNQDLITYYNNLWDLGPALDVNVPNDITKHRDILVAISDEYNVEEVKGAVDLKFQHAMSGIRFAIAPDIVSCIIRKVTITNVCSQGKLFYAYRWCGTGHSWQNVSTPIDYSIEPNLVTGPQENLWDKYNYIDPGTLSQTMMIIPQTVPGCKVIVDIEQIDPSGNPTGVVEQVTANLDPTGEGRPFAPGSILTLRLSYDGWWNGIYILGHRSDPKYPDYHIVTSSDGTYTDFTNKSYEEAIQDEINSGTPPSEAAYYVGEEPIELKYKSFDISNGDNWHRPLDCRLEFNELDAMGNETGWTEKRPDWVYIDHRTCKVHPGMIDPKTGTNYTYYGGEGCLDYSKSFKIGIENQLPDFDVNSDIDNVVYNTPAKGTKAAPYNLSNPSNKPGFGGTGVYTTANCYIIDSGGWYMLPCVYGNAITKGAKNIEAYNPGSVFPSLNNEGCLKNFVNHLGVAISDPFIKNNAQCGDLGTHAMKSADYIWTDTKDEDQHLITDIEYDSSLFGGMGGIRFHVNIIKETSDNWYFGGVNQGNTVIALKDKQGEVMWSWHIWVNPIPNCPESVIEMTNHSGQTYGLMALNLGWISTNTFSVFRQRACKVRIVNYNPNTGKKCEYPAEVELFQREYIKYWHGYSPYWQWGRKDPFIPGLYEGHSVAWWQPKKDGPAGEDDAMTWGQYPVESQKAGLNFGQGVEGLKNRIKYPGIWHCDEVKLIPRRDNAGNIVYNDKGEVENTEHSYDQTFYNLWNADRDYAWQRPPIGTIARPPAGITNVVKTVYDPCPPGYKVPPVNLFTGMSISGDNTMMNEGENKNWLGIPKNYSVQLPNLDIPGNYNGLKGMSGPDGNEYAGWDMYIYLFFADRAQKYTVAFPMSGYRYFWGANLTEIGTDGYYWTAESSSRDRGYYMCYSKNRDADHINPMNEYYHLDGMSIRPIVDDTSWDGPKQSVQSSWARFYDEDQWRTTYYSPSTRAQKFRDEQMRLQELRKSHKLRIRREGSANQTPTSAKRSRREYNAGDIQRRVSRFLPGVFRDRR